MVGGSSERSGLGVAVGGRAMAGSRVTVGSGDKGEEWEVSEKIKVVKERGKVDKLLIKLFLNFNFNYLI